MSADPRTMADLMQELIGDRDRLDAAMTGFYADRVSDEREAAWRADYTRVHILHDLAEDAPWRDHPDALRLRAGAEEIGQRWTTDPEVAPRWAEMHRIYVHTPYVAIFDTDPVPDLPSESPPGEDPVSWRSWLQVRDLTGHGRWTDPTAERSVESGSALADHQPGRALADAVARTGAQRDGTEFDGAER